MVTDMIMSFPRKISTIIKIVLRRSVACLPEFWLVYLNICTPAICVSRSPFLFHFQYSIVRILNIQLWVTAFRFGQYFRPNRKRSHLYLRKKFPITFVYGNWLINYYIYQTDCKVKKKSETFLRFRGPDNKNEQKLRNANSRIPQPAQKKIRTNWQAVNWLKLHTECRLPQSHSITDEERSPRLKSKQELGAEHVHSLVSAESLEF